MSREPFSKSREIRIYPKNLDTYNWINSVALDRAALGRVSAVSLIYTYNAQIICIPSYNSLTHFSLSSHKKGQWQTV